MQITLTYSDIETALKTYVKTMGISREVQNINILALRKGDEPFKAEITLGNADIAIPAVAPVNVPIKRSAASVDTTPAPVTETVAETKEPEVEAKAEVPEEAPAPKVSTAAAPLNLFGG